MRLGAGSLLWFAALASHGAAAMGPVGEPAGTDAEQPPATAPLRSLKPAAIFSKLNLAAAGLEPVAKALAREDRSAALAALRDYYRRKYPRGEPRPLDPSTRAAADQIVRHVFQWGPYEPADYGPDVDWQWDPRGDIESSMAPADEGPPDLDPERKGRPGRRAAAAVAQLAGT